MNDLLKEKHNLLDKHYNNIQNVSLRRLFEENRDRAKQFSLRTNSLYIDFSKNHFTAETLKLLCDFAEARKLPEAIETLLAGGIVNNTEGRPALHSTLRFQGEPTTDEEKMVAETRQKMSAFVDQIHSQQWLGYTGKPIDTIINIGIGGSDLGPRMVVQALSAYKKSLNVQFVANVDGADLSDTVAEINPETTLFIVASKSFSTLETLENALSARQWILDKGCPQEELKNHFVAISTNIKAVIDFGIDENNIFPMWDWVGGRYSLWSAIGLPIALAIGMNNFNALLAGAHEIDQHFAEAPLAENLPAIAGLLTFWYSQYWGATSQAILPYAQRLNRLPAYLQQLDMESLGKSVTRDGDTINYTTGNIIWGTEGTNGQHSFHQLLHQGTVLNPIDFIAIKQPMSSLDHQHRYLQASCISQSQALLKGKTLADAKQELQTQGLSEAAINKLAPHKVIAGNKPSTTIILETLSPKSLGALIAFYEHKVFTYGVLLDINPFDQWGVELGKQLGTPIYDALASGEINDSWDASTKTLIDKLFI